MKSRNTLPQNGGLQDVADELQVILDNSAF
jgi:hypothetical protein